MTDEPDKCIRMTDLSEEDRPREKAMTHGIASLSNTELLTIVIGSGLPGTSALSVAQKMLRDVDNKLSGLRSQSIRALIRNHRGIGAARAVSIAAAFELGVRCRDEQPDEKPQIKCSADIYSYIRGRLEEEPREHFVVLTLSRSNRITGCYKVSEGGTTATVVDVKLLMKEALERLSENIVLVHNHPSGNLKPSPQDIDLTRRIKGAAELFGIRVLDHIIIGHSGYYSFSDEGKL
ncbi:MAG: DNA repair protein RadC [Paramuribaculum sp.]|nr:DNA repair protein RadC [Paramuribaculum sp.]